MRMRQLSYPFLLSTGHACIDLCQGAIPALLPTLLVQHHLSYAAAAGLIFAANIVSSVIQPLFGHFADRLRASWLMPAGLLIAGAGLALSSLFSSYWLIALCMGISGIGIAAFHPEAARLMHQLAGKRKATYMSFFSLGGNLGFALGPVVMTAFLAFFGLGGTALLFLPLLLASVVLLLAFQLRPSAAQSEQRPLEHSSSARMDQWGAFTRLGGVIICRSIVFYGLNAFLALYWINVLHQSQAAGAFALSLLLFTSLVGTLLGGRLADRFGRRRVVIYALTTLFPLLLIFVLASQLNILLAWLLLVPVGICLFVPFSVMVVMGQEYLPNHVGTASGVTLGLAVTVGGIVAPLIGRIADSYGLVLALLVLACVPALGALCTLTLPETRLARS